MNMESHKRYPTYVYVCVVCVCVCQCVCMDTRIYIFRGMYAWYYIHICAFSSLRNNASV